MLMLVEAVGDGGVDPTIVLAALWRVPLLSALPPSARNPVCSPVGRGSAWAMSQLADEPKSATTEPTDAASAAKGKSVACLGVLGNDCKTRFLSKPMADTR